MLYQWVFSSDRRAKTKSDSAPLFDLIVTFEGFNRAKKTL